MDDKVSQEKMSEDELAKSYGSSTRLLIRQNRLTKEGDLKKALECNHQIYEIVWQRYLRCDGEHKERACQSLRDLAKESRNLMVLINKWEETA